MTERGSGSPALGRRTDQFADDPLGILQPRRRVHVALAAERYHVGPLGDMVNVHDAVGEHQDSVGRLGTMYVRRAAVGLALISQVADEPAEQSRRKARRGIDRETLQFAPEHGEDRTALHSPFPATVARAHRPRRHVVLQHATVGPHRRTQERAARQPLWGRRRYRARKRARDLRTSARTGAPRTANRRASVPARVTTAHGNHRERRGRAAAKGAVAAAVAPAEQDARARACRSSRTACDRARSLSTRGGTAPPTSADGCVRCPSPRRPRSTP